jgi:hypothetical protein
MAVVGVVEPPPPSGTVVEAGAAVPGVEDGVVARGGTVVAWAALDGVVAGGAAVVAGRVVVGRAWVVEVVAPGPVAVVVSSWRRTNTVTMATTSRIKISGNSSSGERRRPPPGLSRRSRTAPCAAVGGSFATE